MEGAWKNEFIVGFSVEVFFFNEYRIKIIKISKIVINKNV